MSEEPVSLTFTEEPLELNMAPFMPEVVPTVICFRHIDGAEIDEPIGNLKQYTLTPRDLDSKPENLARKYAKLLGCKPGDVRFGVSFLSASQESPTL